MVSFKKWSYEKRGAVIGAIISLIIFLFGAIPLLCASYGYCEAEYSWSMIYWMIPHIPVSFGIIALVKPLGGYSGLFIMGVVGMIYYAFLGSLIGRLMKNSSKKEYKNKKFKLMRSWQPEN